MSFAKSLVATLLCCVMAVPGFAQQPDMNGGSHGIFQWLTNNYVTHPVANVSFEDSPRMEKLMRAGSIYLSLRDAIALALENNLDLEYARYNPKLSEANLKRVSAGSLLRNVDVYKRQPRGTGNALKVSAARAPDGAQLYFTSAGSTADLLPAPAKRM